MALNANALVYLINAKNVMHLRNIRSHSKNYHMIEWWTAINIRRNDGSNAVFKNHCLIENKTKLWIVCTTNKRLICAVFTTISIYSIFLSWQFISIFAQIEQSTLFNMRTHTQYQRFFPSHYGLWLNFKLTLISWDSSMKKKKKKEIKWIERVGNCSLMEWRKRKYQIFRLIWNHRVMFRKCELCIWILCVNKMCTGEKSEFEFFERKIHVQRLNSAPKNEYAWTKKKEEKKPNKMYKQWSYLYSQCDLQTIDRRREKKTAHT